MTDRDIVQAEVKRMTEEIERLVNARTAYMDEHMPLFAEYAIGDVLFMRRTGDMAGTVRARM